MGSEPPHNYPLPKLVNHQWQRTSEMNKVILAILAVLLPPLAVFLNNGAGKDLLINVVLCFFFYLPGILHALWLVLR